MKKISDLLFYFNNPQHLYYSVCCEILFAVNWILIKFTIPKIIVTRKPKLIFSQCKFYFTKESLNEIILLQSYVYFLCYVPLIILELGCFLRFIWSYVLFLFITALVLLIKVFLNIFDLFIIKKSFLNNVY